MEKLSSWGKDKFGYIPTKIKDLQVLFATLKNKVPTQNCINLINDM